MMSTKFCVVALVLLSSFPILARQTDARVQQSSSTSAASAQANQSASANAHASRNGVQAEGSGAANGSGAVGGVGAANGSANGSAGGEADLRPVNGELASKLDSKNAKVGDPVVFKTTEKTRTADGTVIPKGTRILGRVTDVQAHSKTSQDSQLGIVFDRAELKGGRSLPIHSMIQSISPSPAAMAMANGSADSDLFASPPMGAPMGGGMAAGGAHSGGGLLGGGGAVGSAVGGTGSLAGNGVNTVGSVAGNGNASVAPGLHGATSAAGSATSNAGGSLGGPGFNGAAAGTGLLSAHLTGIPGLMLAGDATGSASGMLSASRRNVHLDSGTQMVLGVSSALAQ